MGARPPINFDIFCIVEYFKRSSDAQARLFYRPPAGDYTASRIYQNCWRNLAKLPKSSLKACPERSERIAAHATFWEKKFLSLKISQPFTMLQGLIIEARYLGEKTTGGYTFELLRCADPGDAAEKLVNKLGSKKERENGIILAMQEVFSELSPNVVCKYGIEVSGYVIVSE